MKLVGLMLVLWAGAVHAQASETYSYYGSTIEREDPPQLRYGTVSESFCMDLYTRGDYVFLIVEREALDKERRFGSTALDANDMKYIIGHDNRRRACLDLLAKIGKLRIWDQVLYYVGKLR